MAPPSMAPHNTTMDLYHSETDSASWAQSDFDASWDEYMLEFDQEVAPRGRRSERQPQQEKGSHSDQGHHHFVPPQYSKLSPDIRRSRKRSSRRSRPASVESLHRLPASEPTYHDVDETLRSVRSLSPERDDSSSMVSAERLNLFPSPMRSPVLHRSESIEQQAKRAARANPITQATSNKGQSKQKESLLMFGDPEETASVMTGMSQQELIIRQTVESKRRKEKKYRKQKEKKKNAVRILNLPASLRGSGGSPSKRKYHRGVGKGENEEQAPVAANKPKNLLSRYSGTRKKTAALAEPAVDGVDRTRDWKLMSSTMSVRSEELESTQGSTYSSQPDLSKDDLLAQAAENWIKSNEETKAAQLSFDELDAGAMETIGNFSDRDGIDQNSTSTNGSGSEEEGPTEADGAFPSLNDARIPVSTTPRLEYEKEAIQESEWQDLAPRTSDWFESIHNQDTPSSSAAVESSDKISDESPVSVLNMYRAERQQRTVQAARSTQRSGLLPPPTEAASRRPRSILRAGRHSGAKEVSAKIQSVKSARVKFHKEVVRRVEVDAEPTVTERQVAPTEAFTPEDWSDFLERDADILSDIPESAESLQTERSETPPSAPTDDVDKGNDLVGVVDKDRDWAVDVQEQDLFGDAQEQDSFGDAQELDSFGDFGQFDEEVVHESDSEGDYSFMETVAAIVIQTAVRRILAMNLAERILILRDSLALEEAQTRKSFSQEYEQNLGIVPSSSEQQHEAFPLEEAQYREDNLALYEQNFEAPHERALVAFPSDSVQPRDAFPVDTPHNEAARSKSENQESAFPSEPMFRDATTLDNKGHFETSFPEQDEKLRAIPSVGERKRIETVSPEAGQHLETARMKQERDLEILPSADAQRDPTIPSSVNTLNLVPSPTGDEVHLEAVPYHLYDIAATQIQSTFRGWWVRDSLNVDHFCACRIQRAYRSYHERMSFVFDIYRIAIIQSLWRRKLATRKVEKLRIEDLEQKKAKKLRLEDIERRKAAKLRMEKLQLVEAERLRAEEKIQREKTERERMEEIQRAEKLRGEAIERKKAEKRRMEEIQREKAEKRRIEELERKEAEKERKERLQRLEAEKLRMGERMEETRLAERRRMEEVEKAENRRMEGIKRREAEQLRVEEHAATKIQSHWRAHEARRDCLDRLVSVLLLQSIARRWLTKKRMSSRILHEVLDRAKHDHDADRWSPVHHDTGAAQFSEEAPMAGMTEQRAVSPDVSPGVSSEDQVEISKEIMLSPVTQIHQDDKELVVSPRWSPIHPDTGRVQEGEQIFHEEARLEGSPERQRAVSPDVSEEYAEILKETISPPPVLSRKIHRVASDAEDETPQKIKAADQKWVTVSDSYDEDTLVQSIVSSKEQSAAAASIASSKDKTEVTDLSADQVIELFIHMSANKETDRDVTPLRMESPVMLGQQARGAVSATGSQATPKAEEKVKMDGRPPRVERSESEEAALDEQVLLAKEKVDRMNAQLAKKKVQATDDKSSANESWSGPVEF